MNAVRDLSVKLHIIRYCLFVGVINQLFDRSPAIIDSDFPQRCGDSYFFQKLLYPGDLLSGRSVDGHLERNRKPYNLPVQELFPGFFPQAANRVIEIVRDGKLFASG